MKGFGWVPKALLNFQQIVGVKEYFLQLRELEWFSQTFLNFKAVENILRFSFQSQIIFNNSSKTRYFHTSGNIWNKRHVHYFFLAPATVQNMVNAIHWINL